MILETFSSGPIGTNGIIVACIETKEAALVDAPIGSLNKYLSLIKGHGLKPKVLLLTHAHWDHIGDAQAIATTLNIPIWMHESEAGHLIDPSSSKLPTFCQITPSKPSHFLIEKDSFMIGKLKFDVLHTPGHSPGGLCFYCKAKNLLLSGDTLFNGAMGRVDLPGSNPQHMRESLIKLSHLPPQTAVYPGHGEMTTIGDESWITE